jgi:hypothetical protein
MEQGLNSQGGTCQFEREVVQSRLSAMLLRAFISRKLFFAYSLALSLLHPVTLLWAADATFFRAINLNGPALTIDGRNWEAGAEAKDFQATGKTFENQKVLLKPATDTARAQMIRSSVWGDRVELALTNVPPGAYQVFLYVWEDNHSEKFSLSVNDRVVVEEFHSGSAGMWRRLGPWRCESVNGKITVSARQLVRLGNLGGRWSGAPGGGNAIRQQPDGGPDRVL